MASPHDDHSAGHLLDGRVRYAQPRGGFRSGIEPVLLAATIPASPRSRVLEAGSGAGATLLCIAARVPGVSGVGIERDAALVSLARQNAEANGWRDLRFIAGDVAALSLSDAFDHACANPPYHAAAGTLSPDAARRAAKRSDTGLLAAWAGALARQLRPRGTLTFILPASLLPEATAALATAGCAPSAALPLWPREGIAAKLLILRGVKGSRAPFRLLPGLVLHAADGTFTAAAEAILRGAAALEL
jgi:tRNA1(Val) A37 N6-methylase TrmN6